MKTPDEAGPADPARLFLALWPDAPACAAIAAWQAACAWPAGARLVPRAHLHVTLHFLGAVPRARIAQLGAALAGPVEPVALVLSKAALWHGGIAVLEPDAVPPALAALHARLGTVLARLGLPPETRAYRPHVTLARQAGGATLVASDEPPTWTARGVALVESAGGRYETLPRPPRHAGSAAGA